MNGYVIRYKSKYWDRNHGEFTDERDATLFDEYEDARVIIDDIAKTLEDGHITILERKQELVFSMYVNDAKNWIYDIVNKNKVSYNTIERKLEDIKTWAADKLNDVVPHKNTSFIEKMLTGYPLNIVRIENEQISYARNFKTAFDFIDGKIALSGDYIPELKDVTFNDLPVLLQNKILGHYFRVIVIE